MDSPIAQRFQTVDHPLYNLSSTSRNTVQFTVPSTGDVFTVEELAAMLLEHAQRFANDHSGSTIVDTVLTVPPYFREDQIHLMKQVAQLAGLNVVSVITELEAVAIDYSLRGHMEVKHKVILFDVGTRTSSAALVEVSYDRGVLVRTLASETSPYGGRDLDRLLAVYVDNKLDVQTKDPSGKTWDNLLLEAKKAKEFLSASNFADIEVLQTPTRITREVFESLAADTFMGMVQPLNANASDITAVELFGGGTRIPALQALIQKETGISVGKHINADEAAALGACHHAAVLKKARFARRVALINNLPKIASASPSVVLSSSEMEASKEKLEEWRAREQARELTLKQRSELESYVLDIKYKLDEISNSADLEQLKAILEQTNEWLERTTQEHQWKEYSHKLTEVKSQVEP
eukprot:CAMPEP_0168549684 /NCGR_PEP_ID=MMETSP0413-20121227/5232_1 /TAXON_ID=136452 /ORGANISM="Filamoeba nolandi, Strain NC-AS-23-1" /LENGTH=407 /DNA_ID=CAMNT_0008580083 /DNA_START=394 /DNA_END=1613 /DNA_ORIENTATION=-